MGKPCMIFAPNMSGPLHLGSGLVLWLTAKEAEARGCRLLIRIDDISHRHLPTEDLIPIGYSMATRCEAVESIVNSCKLLGLPDPEGYTYYLSQRSGRYNEWAGMLLDRGVIVKDAEGLFLLTDHRTVHDHVQGNRPGDSAGVRKYKVSNSNTRFDFRQIVMSLYRPRSTAVCVFDAIDFDVPLHIRGMDIECDMWDEVGIWRDIMRGFPELARPQLEYAHVPIICEADGNALHKTKEHNNLYNFENWARQFPTPEARREALERMVLEPGKPYALGNIQRYRYMSVDTTGIALVGWFHNIKSDSTTIDVTSKTGKYRKEAIS